MRDFLDSIQPNPPGSVEKHERNHHQVWLNVYLPSYKLLVGKYENICCVNCDARLKKLLEQFATLKDTLLSWEQIQEYGEHNAGPYKEPNIGYGTTEKTFELKEPPTPCIL